MTPSAYMRRNTLGTLRANPPLSAYGRAQTRRVSPRPSASRPRKARQSASIAAVRLGTPIEIVYRHVHGGTYKHRFGRGAQLVHTADGTALIITGANVKAFIEG